MYNEPLTLEMLQRMHVAKNRKEAHQKMIDDAQVEAKEQVRKPQQQNKYINKVQASSRPQLPMPILTVAVENLQKFHKALLDSRANANIMPLSIYNTQHNKAKSESQDYLYNFQRQSITSHGNAFINIYFQGLLCKTNFQIMDCKEDSTIILDKPWIVLHQCELNFATTCIIFSLHNHQLSTPMKTEHWHQGYMINQLKRMG